MKKFNIKFVFMFVVALIMVLSISACATEETVEAPTTEEVATEAVTEVATEEVATEVAGEIVPEFTFNNTGEEEICEIYLSPVGQENWGPDQLGGATIPAGGSYVLQNIPAGSYDIKAIGCAGSEVVGQIDIQP
ncbi:MAG: hypothetical protein HYZ22_13315 [Chloroflexi bacterium]|nr:hypothetical protein [Chloroflexota bacterium]